MKLNTTERLGFLFHRWAHRLIRNSLKERLRKLDIALPAGYSEYDSILLWSYANEACMECMEEDLDVGFDLDVIRADRRRMKARARLNDERARRRDHLKRLDLDPDMHLSITANHKDHEHQLSGKSASAEAQ